MASGGKLKNIILFAGLVTISIVASSILFANLSDSSAYFPLPPANPPIINPGEKIVQIEVPVVSLPPEQILNNWKAPGTPPAYDKIPAVETDDGDASYLLSKVNNDHQTFNFQTIDFPSLTVIKKLELNVIAKKTGPAAQTTKISLTVARGTTLSDLPLGGISISPGYTTYARDVTNDPFALTPTAFTLPEVESWQSGGLPITFGMAQNTDSKEIRVTKVAMKINFQDNTKPSTTAQIEASGSGPYPPGTLVTLTCNDERPGSGPGDIFYGLNTQDESTLYSAGISVSQPGLNTINYHCLDNVGNVGDSGQIQITIIDPKIDTVLEFDTGQFPSPNYWSDEETITGILKDVDDVPVQGGIITFDVIDDDSAVFPDATTEADGSFSSTGNLPDSVGSFQLQANFIGNSQYYESSTGLLTFTTDPHPVSIDFNDIEAAGVDKRVVVIAKMTDTVLGFDMLPGVLINLEGTGGFDPNFVDPTSGGVTVEDDGGLVVDACNSPIPCAVPTNIARLNEVTGEVRFGINLPPPSVSLVLTDNGPNDKVITFEVTSGPTEVIDGGTSQGFIGDPEVYSQTETLLGGSSNAFNFNHLNGISKIRVTDTSDDSTLGVSKISTSTSTALIIQSGGFPLGSTTDPISFGNDIFFAEGTAPSTTGEFGVSANIVPSLYTGSDTEPFLAIPSSGGGTGGTSNANILDINGLMFSGRDCLTSGGDTDGDALCNDWETAGGVPFTVTAGGAAQPFVYYLTPPPIQGEKDLYYEIDYMAGHNPLDAALTSVAGKFLDQAPDINFNWFRSESLTHAALTDTWGDNDLLVDDFNSFKRDFNAGVNERARGSAQNLQTNGVTNLGGGNYRIAISGVTVTTPNPSLVNAAYGDDTQGTIILKVRINCGTSSCNVAASPAGAGILYSNPTSTVAAASGLNIAATLPAATIALDSATIKVVEIKVPFWTINAISNVSLGTISIDVKVTAATTPYAAISGLATTAFTTKAGSPGVSSTLEEARAAAIRYMVWVHSIGGQSAQGEIKGNDIVVSLSGFGGASDGFGGTQGDLETQKGTIMHEVGHNLNLKHGGPRTLLGSTSVIGNSDINCKPNYPSVMSYARQRANYFGTTPWNDYGVLDFSDGGLSSMIENAADETLPFTNLDGSVPMSPSGGELPYIIWASPVVSPASGTNTTPHISPDHTSHYALAIPSDGWINWDDDITIDSSPITSVNLNHFGVRECDNPTPVIRTTADNDGNDWGNLDFDFRGIATPFDGVEPSATGAAITVTTTETSTVIPPPFTRDSTQVNANVPLKVRFVDRTDTSKIIVTQTPPFAGFVEFSRGCGPTYTLIPTPTLVWNEGSQLLNTAYKTTNADKGKDLCFKVWVEITDEDGIKTKRLMTGDVAPNNEVVKDNQQERVTYRITVRAK